MKSIAKAYFDHSGRPLSLKAEIGRGGEGAVFVVSRRPADVAKIYHNNLDADRGAKLAAMCEGAAPKVMAIAAWPKEVICDPAGRSVGVILPKVRGRPLHDLYAPRSRKMHFPNADFAFLVQVATNLARGFATLHDARIIVGDVNSGGALILADATIKLIDCDSFQFTKCGEHVFRCGVGSGLFTPPELQGQNLGNVLRTPSHDAFGLAILIFHLLFLGRHPFAGQCLGGEDMPIEKAIAQYRFAYAVCEPDPVMRPPPHVPPLAIYPASIKDLFHRAFGRNLAARPPAYAWVEVLQELSGALRRCSRQAQHVFPASASTCPWCAYEQATGIQLFALSSFAAPDLETFDPQQYWDTITSIAPRALPAVPSLASLPRHLPSVAAVTAAKACARLTSQTRWIVATLAATTLAIALMTATALSSASPACGVMIAAALAFCVRGYLGKDKLRRPFVQALAAAEGALGAQLLAYEDVRLKGNAAVACMERKRRSLEQKVRALKGLPTKRSSKLRKLEEQRRTQQLQASLALFSIKQAGIPALGALRLATLARFGIVTAADIRKEALYAVPGIGLALSQSLLAWRQGLEQRFRLDARKPVEQKHLDAAERAIRKEKSKLEASLLSGARDLQAIKNQIERSYAVAVADLDRAMRDCLQARADLACFDEASWQN